jgi:sensor histidine kinase YesM
VLAHVGFWVFQLLLNWYMTNISFNTFNRFDQVILFQLSLTGTLNLMLFYYPLAYFVLPQISNGKYISGFLLLVLQVFLYAAVNAIGEETVLTHCESCMLQIKQSQTGYYQFLKGFWLNRVLAKVLSLGTVFGLVFTISTPLAIKIALGAFRKQIRAIQLAKENVELEFNFLKSQVNPHFLFNTLNNIYGLILGGKPDRSAELVSRLSSLLRYILYESNHQSMPLSKEINLIKDYIELEKVRLNFTRVSFSENLDAQSYQIAPLLLMPLIENAFKFCADDASSHININIDVLNGKFYLKIENTVDFNREGNTNGGIGLANFNKRLSLYYPGRYQYRAGREDELYVVHLTINLL